MQQHPTACRTTNRQAIVAAHASNIADAQLYIAGKYHARAQACPSVCVAAGLAIAAVVVDASMMPKVALDPSQITVPYVVEHAQEVAGIGMAVLAAGLLMMVLLSLLGNCGLQAEADEAYAPAAATVSVQVQKRKVGPSAGARMSYQMPMRLSWLWVAKGCAFPAVQRWVVLTDIMSVGNSCPA